MSKEPLKSFINKVGTFRGKNKSHNRPSASDLKFGNENDESIFKPPMHLDDHTFSMNNDTVSELDTTKSFMTGSYRY